MGGTSRGGNKRNGQGVPKPEIFLHHNISLPTRGTGDLVTGICCGLRGEWKETDNNILGSLLAYLT